MRAYAEALPIESRPSNPTDNPFTIMNDERTSHTARVHSVGPQTVNGMQRTISKKVSTRSLVSAPSAMYVAAGELRSHCRVG